MAHDKIKNANCPRNILKTDRQFKGWTIMTILHLSKLMTQILRNHTVRRVRTFDGHNNPSH